MSLSSPSTFLCVAGSCTVVDKNAHTMGARQMVIDCINSVYKCTLIMLIRRKWWPFTAKENIKQYFLIYMEILMDRVRSSLWGRASFHTVWGNARIFSHIWLCTRSLPNFPLFKQSRKTLMKMTNLKKNMELIPVAGRNKEICPRNNHHWNPWCTVGTIYIQFEQRDFNRLRRTPPLMNSKEVNPTQRHYIEYIVLKTMQKIFIKEFAAIVRSVWTPPPSPI